MPGAEVPTETPLVMIPMMKTEGGDWQEVGVGTGWVEHRFTPQLQGVGEGRLLPVCMYTCVCAHVCALVGVSHGGRKRIILGRKFFMTPK